MRVVACSSEDGKQLTESTYVWVELDTTMSTLLLHQGLLSITQYDFGLVPNRLSSMFSLVCVCILGGVLFMDCIIDETDREANQDFSLFLYTDPLDSIIS